MITSAEQFIKLRNSGDRQDYVRAASEKAPTKVWLQILRHADMRQWVAHNKTVPLTVLNCLCSDPDPSVRLTVAMKGKLNERIFNRLSKDPDSRVRIALVNNRSTPVKILEKLANDASEFVSHKARARIDSVTQAAAESLEKCAVGV